MDLKLTYQDKAIDFSQPFDRLTLVQAIEKYNDQFESKDLLNTEFIEQSLQKMGEELPPNRSLGSLQLALFEAVAEEHLWNPTFIIDYPTEVSPLARHQIMIRTLRSVLNYLSRAEKLPMVSRSSMTLKSKLNVSKNRSNKKRRGMMRRCIMTQILSVLLSMACPRQAVAGLVLID